MPVEPKFALRDKVRRARYPDPENVLENEIHEVTSRQTHMDVDGNITHFTYDLRRIHPPAGIHGSPNSYNISEYMLQKYEENVSKFKNGDKVHFKDDDQVFTVWYVYPTQMAYDLTVDDEPGSHLTGPEKIPERLLEHDVDVRVDDVYVQSDEETTVVRHVTGLLDGKIYYRHTRATVDNVDYAHEQLFLEFAGKRVFRKGEK